MKTHIRHYDVILSFLLFLVSCPLYPSKSLSTPPLQVENHLRFRIPKFLHRNPKAKMFTTAILGTRRRHHKSVGHSQRAKKTSTGDPGVDELSLGETYNYLARVAFPECTTISHKLSHAIEARQLLGKRETFVVYGTVQIHKISQAV